MIDDDVPLTELVGSFMSENGHAFTAAHSVSEGRSALHNVVPDLVLLDVMRPGGSGLDMVKEIRQTSDVPVLMLTARGGVSDRIQGLEGGADDYLAKPFEPRELLLRVSAILRRGQPRPNEEARRLVFGDVAVDFTTRTVELDGKDLGLTTAEFEVMALFANRPNEALSREQISQRLRGTGWEAISRSLDVLMSRLRQKLGDDPKNPRYFKTVWGVGYMFIGKPAES
jgi:two-component system phosphate regulon response regulator OmpR